MFKKLKRIYYRKRDRGKGKQFLFTVCLIGLVVLATIGYGSMVAMEYLSMPAPTETKEPDKKSPRPETEDAEQASEPEETEVPEDADEEEEIDLSGMETFLAFMKDEDYDRLLEEVKKICDDKGYDFAEKMTYQETGQTDFVVISYILFPMDTIMKCTYDMNTGDYTLEETMYSEADIEDFELEQEIKEEEEAAQETIEPTPTVQPTEKPISTEQPTTAPVTSEPEPTVMPDSTSRPEATKKPKKKAKKKKSKDSKTTKKVHKKKQKTTPPTIKRPAPVQRKNKTNNKQEGSIGNGTATIQ